MTDAVPGEVREWQNRPLDPVYPVVFFDALRAKVRDDGLVATRLSMSRPLSMSTAISFCDAEERAHLRDIETLIRQRLPVQRTVAAAPHFRRPPRRPTPVAAA